MKPSKTPTFVVGASALIIVLGGCSTGSPQVSSPLSLARQNVTRSASISGIDGPSADLFASTAPLARPDRSRSWMEQNTRARALLYVSDIFTDDVYVYNYPKGTLAGTLTGFENPGDMCVDKVGNIWITDYASQEVSEYAHGGTSPIAVLNNPVAPYSCAVNKKTGDLAVGGRGSIEVYKGASGTPKAYQGYFTEAREVGYVGNTLYISGFGNPSSFELAAIKRGHVIPITISGATINFPGSVQAANGFLTLGDAKGNSGNAVIYTLVVKGNSATTMASTQLLGNSTCYQSIIWNKKVVASNYNVGVVNTYAFPAGGAPDGTITGGGGYPFGVAISK